MHSSHTFALLLEPKRHDRNIIRNHSDYKNCVGCLCISVSTECLIRTTRSFSLIALPCPEYIRCTVTQHALAVSQCLGRGIACVSATLMHSAEHVGGLFGAAEVLLLCRADRAACVLKWRGQLAAEGKHKTALEPCTVITTARLRISYKTFSNKGLFSYYK